MSLIDQMIGLNARLTAIPQRFGVQQYNHTLLLRHSTLDPVTLTTTTTDTFLNAMAIATVQRSYVGLEVGGAGAFNSNNAITIAQSDWQVSNLPRSYTRDFLIQDVQWWWIDAPVDPNNPTAPLLDSNGYPTAGIPCKLLFLQDNKDDILTWTAILREFRDHYDNTRSVVLY